ncbi:hypothetical protein MNAN1_000779 [Malassezia nana]|uniref:PhoD-like phosphatase domain-containing protein n=1 Tax=Malassezia nana TaxID=180528 RepID=A0AAF0EHX7_9BASI|nr:hypothetical protein MNAN1_000779 [Malassezia nana]
MANWQVDVGPLLRYDTVDAYGVYHAFVLLITQHTAATMPRAPPLLQYVPMAEQKPTGPPMQTRGLRLWVYNDDANRAHIFWRFKIEVKMLRVPQSVAYTIVDATDLVDFHIPAYHQNFRWASYSCAGFSASVKQDEFHGPDPMWNDLLIEHAKNPFHVLVGGGDQIYNDVVAKQDGIEQNIFVPKKLTEEGEEVPLDPRYVQIIDRCLFQNYVQWFGSGAMARAFSRIPMVNMLDDHDLIDGFGTYTEDLMQAPVFNLVGSRGYFFYLLFQQFMNDEVDGVLNENTTNPNPSQFRSLIIGGPGSYIAFPTHSFLIWLGPKQHMLLLDCRAQRKLNQVCAEDTYERVIKACMNLPESVRHLIFLLSVPIAYPRMVFLEKMLASKFNPFVKVAKATVPSFTNNFDGSVEVLDDLNDHWCSHHHKKERNQLIEQTQMIAKEKKLRITFLSGDVHAASCGVFSSETEIRPEQDYKYSLALITSAIVNAPPPPAVIKMTNKLATKQHRSLHHVATRETMLPLFELDLNDQPNKQKYIMGARNWCAANYDEATNEILFQLRIEKKQGSGRAKEYTVKAPAPLF